LLRIDSLELPHLKLSLAHRTRSEDLGACPDKGLDATRAAKVNLKHARQAVWGWTLARPAAAPAVTGSSKPPLSICALVVSINFHPLRPTPCEDWSHLLLHAPGLARQYHPSPATMAERDNADSALRRGCVVGHRKIEDLHSTSSMQVIPTSRSSKDPAWCKG
jgi:hypothetical protein